MDDVRFDFDSSFIRPEAKRELAMLADIAATVPDSPLSLFGHADQVGTEAYNKALSGRRARAMYGLVVRDLDVWEQLYTQPFGSDSWGERSVRTMLSTVTSPVTGSPYDPSAGLVAAARSYQLDRGLTADGIVGPVTRRALFADYMDALCNGDALRFPPSRFLGGGGGGKADCQGCSELNPVLVPSASETATLEAPSRRDERNATYAPNRRVVAFFFDPSTVFDKGLWPCPTADESAAGCERRLWAKGRAHLQPGATERLYEETLDTFACRFYQRLALRSPCEGASRIIVFSLRLLNRRMQPLPNVPFRVEHGTQSADGITDADAFLRVRVLARPAAIVVSWCDPTDPTYPPGELPFTRKVWVDVGEGPEADARRLENLGYVEDDMQVNVRHFQQNQGLPVTGKLDDIRAELRSVHDVELGGS
jgi:hypothetical protein